jgi:hypothetical protein
VNLEQRMVTTRWVLIVAGAVGAGLILALTVVGSAHYNEGLIGAGQDAHAYWAAVRIPPYYANAGDFGAYLYSPAFMQALSPVLKLQWDQFLTAWAALMIGALLVMTGPVLFVFALPLAFLEIWGGNIHLLLALAIVMGFRWSGTWSFPLLTKVTPGIGVLWFAARKEWQALAIALATTGVIVAVSFALNPGLWRSWIDLLFREAGGTASPGQIPIPLWLRLPVAAALAIYAARRDMKWLLPLVAVVAMPVLWWSSLTVLIGCVALERERIEKNVLAAIADLPNWLRDQFSEPGRELLPEPEA